VVVLRSPVSGVVYSPGGNGQPSCIHHVSLASLNAMCKHGAVAKCPTSGCKGKWSLKTAVLDEDFERKVQRFLRDKSLAELAAQEGGAAEESKDEYTQL
jgi:hypothetical protein